MTQSSHISKIHYKLAISDILNSSVDLITNAFSCKIRKNGEMSSIEYQNVRIAGLVIEKSDKYFKIDDGTGIIKVVLKNPDDFILPKVGDYAEVLGSVINQKPYSIEMKCVSVKADPMFEVRHLLELAVMHKDFNEFQYLTDDSLITSTQSQTTEISKLSEKVLVYIKGKNGSATTIDELIDICGTTEIANVVLEALQQEPLIYQDGQNYFAI